MFSKRCGKILLFIVLLFFCFVSAHAAETAKIDPALCRNQVAYRPDPGVDYKAGVDVDGHYVAPADATNGNAVVLPKVINIPLTLSLVKVLNLDTTQAPYNQLGPETEVPLGTITVEGNKVTLNGKPLSDAQQSKIAAACARQ